MPVTLSRRAFLKLAGLAGGGWVLGLRPGGASVYAAGRLRLLASNQIIPTSVLAVFTQATNIAVEVTPATDAQSISGYDLALVPSHTLFNLIRRGHVRPLGSIALPVPLEQRAYDPLNAFSLPAARGAIGINARRVTPPTTWAELFALAATEPTYLPRVETFHAALKLQGHSLNTRNFVARNTARQLLSKLESAPLAQARFAIGAQRPGWNFTVPVEGAELWEDCFCLPADSPQPELAHAFIRVALETQPLTPLPDLPLEPRSPFAPTL